MDRLATLGYHVATQPVDGQRFNVVATTGAAPDVVLSTHFDCVPPFFPSRVEGDRLYGRGACDAKCILAAQVAAAGRLRALGIDRVGLLFVVGEERGSEGAMVANQSAYRVPLPRQRRADRQPVGSRHARRVEREASRHGSRRALVATRTGRVGDRQARRCHRLDAAARTAADDVPLVSYAGWERMNMLALPVLAVVVVAVVWLARLRRAPAAV